MIHYARIKNSLRLQRLLQYLHDGIFHSTRDIIYGAHVCAVNSAICELRAQGCEIEHREEHKIHLYRLIAIPNEFRRYLRKGGE